MQISYGVTWVDTTPIRRFAVFALAVALVFSLGATVSAADYDPAADVNSMYNTTKYIGARAWWNAGYTGQGVDVAVIDTGVAPVPGLDAPGKVVYGPDFSLESQVPELRDLDTNGHGTFMAGLIAGRDPGLAAPYSDPSIYTGVAPGARIVSVKVGTADGGVDVSQVIAAITWLTEHRNVNGLNIRVINLSYGTNTAQSSLYDPLSYAVEQAWKKGIVVVAATGNSGFQQPPMTVAVQGLANPAYNPWIFSVGASDSMYTMTQTDDQPASFSASGFGTAGYNKNPDIVAPGAHMQGLRVPGSFLDMTYPEAVFGDRFFRGSGTSEAAAIASGAIALVLSRYPTLTPDRVKKYLRDYGYDLKQPGSKNLWQAKVQGQGELSMLPMLAKTPGSSVQKFNNGLGNGSLEITRGSDHLTQNEIALIGAKDIMGEPYDSVAMAQLIATGRSWTGDDFNGRSWTGRSWTGDDWTGRSWTTDNFSGRSWTGRSWTGDAWSGRSWSGDDWTGQVWASAGWY